MIYLLGTIIMENITPIVQFGVCFLAFHLAEFLGRRGNHSLVCLRTGELRLCTVLAARKPSLLSVEAVAAL